jgi:hypothetical protein
VSFAFLDLTMNDRIDKPTSPTQALAWSPELAPPDYCDPVIEAYKKDVDRTLLRQNLALSVEERIRKAEALNASQAAWRGTGKRVAGIGGKDSS